MSLEKTLGLEELNISFMPPEYDCIIQHNAYGMGMYHARIFDRYNYIRENFIYSVAAVTPERLEFIVKHIVDIDISKQVRTYPNFLAWHKRHFKKHLTEDDLRRVRTRFQGWS